MVIGKAAGGSSPAEDVAAETFAVAYGQRDRFDPGRGSLRPWLFGIATNLIARYRRKETRHTLVIDPSTGQIRATNFFVDIRGAEYWQQIPNAAVTGRWTDTLP